jgi:hypothetical protein
MALMEFLILRRPPTGPRCARPEDRLRGRLEGRTVLTQPNFNFFTCSQGRDTEGKHMRKHIGWLWIVGFFSLVAAANAQTASPPAPITQFDGTYAWVSATKLHETFFAAETEHIFQCPDYYPTGQPLTIVNGNAQFLGNGAGVRFQWNGRPARRAGDETPSRTWW